MPNADVLLMPWAPRRQNFGFNDKKSPFGSNLKLRQAAAYATDKESIAKVMGLEAGSPNHWWGWNKAWSGFDDKLPYYEYSPEKAQAMLKEAGFPNGVDVDLMCYSGNTHRRYTEMLQSMWTKIGIRAAMSPIETVAGKAKAKAGEFEAFAWDMSPSPDPAHFNRMFLCTGEANWNNYCNPDMDKCMLDAERETDATKRAGIYKKCQRIQYEDAQIGGMHFVSSVVAMNKKVKGLRVQTGMINTSDVWLEK